MNQSTRDFTSLKGDFSRIKMLPSSSVWDYLVMCRLQHPDFYRYLNASRVSVERVSILFDKIAKLSTHFESKLENGRGDSYRKAQNTNYLNRSVGFLRLFDLAVQERESTNTNFTVLDALGGNGTLTRIVRASHPLKNIPLIVTSDVSGRMVESALAQNLPAVRLPLQDLIWFDDCSFDAVIVAYGTHHIPPEDRSKAIAEAYRVLKPGGRIVIQDFEIGCPTTLWYENVLDRYTLTGHKFKYFTRQNFNDLLADNSFVDVQVMDVYDPLFVYAEDPETAKRQLLEYVFTLFALEKLIPVDGILNERFWQELETVIRETSTFKPGQLPDASNGLKEFSILKDGDRYRAEIPRVCLAATGRRDTSIKYPSKGES